MPPVLRIALILSVCSLAGCQPQVVEYSIPFELRYDGKPVACDTIEDGISLTDFRMYVAQPTVGDTAVAMVTDGFWQREDVALIDLENGRGACRNGTERTNNRLRLKIPHNDQRGLAFVIGVPESLNHANPVEALPPLGFTDMHWHWRSGYKFMRLGIDARDGRRWIHIGSSRCAGTISELQGCRNSNRSNVRLPDFVPGRHGVVIDIGSFFDTTAPPATCASGPTELACVRPFQQLGIDFDSGKSVSPAAVFGLVELE